MYNLDNTISTLTQKTLEKPVLNFSNFNITLTDLLYVGIIIFVAYMVHIGLRLFLNIQVKRDKMRRAQSKTLLQLAGYVITILAITYIFSAVGYSITYLLVGSTAILVGLGFGLQQLFVDLISGVILLIDKNINYGDVVKVEIPSTNSVMFGKIVQIGLRATLLENIDNEIMIVPNSKVLSSGIRSLMRDRGSVRFRIQIQVMYDADMELAKKLLVQAVLENSKTDKEPLPTIIVKSFKESGIELEIRFWMKELFNSEQILSDIRFKILELFKENNLEIPLPHRVMVQK